MYGIRLRELFQGVADAPLHIGGGEGLELKYRTAGQQCIIDVKVRVLGGGGNEGDSALLNTFQQALLLTLVKVLDLIQIQQNAARCPQCADVCQHGLDIAG